jgi:hypothetical protein
MSRATLSLLIRTRGDDKGLPLVDWPISLMKLAAMPSKVDSGTRRWDVPEPTDSTNARQPRELLDAWISARMTENSPE